jgi:hypothetical protein
LLEQYNFAIFDGLLTVENLEMTIIPKEKTITFGEEIGDFEFDYNFNDDPSNPLNITPDIESAITSAVSTAHATVLVNARATALVNASATALVNYSFLISATALVNSNDDVYDLQLSNAAATALVNGNATPLVNGAATATVLVNGVSRATVLVNATALVNGTATVLVNGTATPLVNATALVNANATALVNSSTINGNSNSQAIVILGEEDIEVLLGNQPGDIVLKSLNLVPSTDVGSHWVLPGSLIYPNLNITYDAGGPLNVLPAPAEVTFDPISLSQVYDGTPKSVLPLSAPEGLLFDVLYDGETDLPFEAGTYEVTATVNDLNYIGTASTQLVIDPAELTVAADERFKTYGTTDPDLTYQITDGTLYGEDGFTGSLTRETGEDAGVYAIQQGDLAAGPNYTLTFVGNTLTIDPALITVTADPQSKTYGESDPSLTYLVTEGALVGEDGFTGMLSRAEGEVVGVYPIQQGDLTAGTNYTLTFVGNNLTIDPAQITVTADPQSKTYGASDPLLTYQITSGALVPGDNFTGLLIREPGENAGAYAILQGDLSVSDNYLITYVGNNFVINAADITVTADDQSKTYGEADPELTFSVTSGALVGEDSFNGTLTRESGEHVGNYSITQGSLSAGDNYNLSVVSGTLTIDPRSLTVAAVDDHKTYGEPDPFFTYQILSGSLINGDALSGHVDRESGEDAGTYAITQGTLDAGSNYDLMFINGTFTINKAWLLIKVSPKYQWTFEGDPDPDITFAFFGFVNGDDENDLTSLGYVTWPNYSGQCGIYKVFPQATSPNYDISIKKGYLIVYEYDGIAGGGGQTEDPMYKTSDLDLVEVSEITAYPNPASSQVYLKLNGNTVTSDDILVFDIQGNQVRIDDIRPSGGTMELDISRLETGVYFIHINLETDKQLIRIIKQ